MSDRLLTADHICVALDVEDLERVRAIVTALAPAGVRVFKIGLGLWCQHGAAAIAVVRDGGGEVFLDLKLHDIPHQVRLAVRAVRGLGARYLTVHAGGGPEMVHAAAEAAGDDMRILAVTVLTSLPAVEAMVVSHARGSVAAGAHGIVCSAREVAAVRAGVGPDALLVTPGIRAAGANAQDQNRVGTPAEAFAAGSDLLVVGRPILEAHDPLAGLAAILAS